MKKLLSIFMIFCLLMAFAGCGKKSDDTSSAGSVTESVISEEPVVEPEPEPVVKGEINPLTGVSNLKESAVNNRPVAIMVNNIETAWGVQSGLSKADVVYEAYVEGNITRLLAVYKDLSAVGKTEIGSLRSARYSFVDLALGHGAQFVHAGRDEDYCTPHIAEVGATTVDLNTGGSTPTSVPGGRYAYRNSNGLSTEHTLFTNGKKLYDGLKSLGVAKMDGPGENWMNFLEEGSEYVPDSGKCKKLYVPFSGRYNAEFEYDKKSNKYVKVRNGSNQIDAGTKKAVAFSNVLVLYADTYFLSDNYHQKTELTSGSGYYVSNGGYMEINWSKGGAHSSFQITDATGAEIDFNPGNTYVCLPRPSCKNNTTFN